MSNGDMEKPVQIGLTSEDRASLRLGLQALIAQVKRSMVKEVDPLVRDVREKFVNRLNVLLMKLH